MRNTRQDIETIVTAAPSNTEISATAPAATAQGLTTGAATNTDVSAEVAVVPMNDLLSIDEIPLNRSPVALITPLVRTVPTPAVNERDEVKLRIFISYIINYLTFVCNIGEPG